MFKSVWVSSLHFCNYYVIPKFLVKDHKLFNLCLLALLKESFIGSQTLAKKSIFIALVQYYTNIIEVLIIKFWILMITSFVSLSC